MDTRAMAVALLTKWSWDKMLDVKTVWHLWRTEITVRIHSFSCLCAIISTTQGRWSRVQVQTTKANGKGLFFWGGGIQNKQVRWRRLECLFLPSAVLNKQIALFTSAHWIMSLTCMPCARARWERDPVIHCRRSAVLRFASTNLQM